jgi:hypothetical protein
VRAALQQKVTALHLALLACVAALAWQTLALDDTRKHHSAALQTVAELTLTKQQCESVVEQAGLR